MPRLYPKPLSTQLVVKPIEQAREFFLWVGDSRNEVRCRSVKGEFKPFTIQGGATMEFWMILIIVIAAGGIGGIVNALMTDNGFVLPKSAPTVDGRIVRPGFLGNILIGGVAGGISWGLYGPFAAYPLIGGTASTTQDPVHLTLSAFVGAVLVGVGGARWLTNEVDKTLLRAAASQAAAGGANNQVAAQILAASPAQALRLATKREVP